MDPANKDIFCVFDFLDIEARCIPKFEDEVIASNLYYVSLPHSLGIMSGVTDENRRKEMCNLNEWLQSIIPEVSNVHVLNFDRIKKHIIDCQGLKSCDAYFYDSDSGKCFLIEFKASTKEELIKKKMLDLKTDNDDAIVRKVAHSKTIMEKVCFNREGITEDLVARTHVIVVYNGKNTEASSTSVRNLLPGKKKCVDKGKQSRASFQTGGYKKEVAQATKRFADYVQKNLGYCAATKKEFPGSAYPDESPRGATFMTVGDFSKAVTTLFVDWDWGDYLPYFAGVASVVKKVDEKVLEPV